MRHSSHALSLAALLTCTACISMPAARSAETRPGPSVELSNSVAFAPGGTSRCVLSKPLFECSELLVGGSVGMSYGWISDGRPAGRALGAGLSAADGRILPYLDYYQQQRSGESPRGLGARVATSIGGWTEVQAYARVDHWLASGQVITWNHALIAMTGKFGFSRRTAPMAWAPSINGIIRSVLRSLIAAAWRANSATPSTPSPAARTW